MSDGPTRGAEEAEARAWGSRPGLALGVKVVTVLLPIAAAVGVTTVVGPHLFRPDGGVGTLAWLVQLAVLSTATVLVVDRFARRLVPLAGLLNLSLVFPDEAPSRFGMALKSGTTKRLRAELAERPEDETANEAATRLLAMVGELNDHDRLTRGHTERVRAYSDLIAEELDLDEEDRWKLRWAVLLHDIGKLTVPVEILNKDGRPTDEEWAVLRNHPAAGAEMVEPLAEWLGDWRLAAGQHHERWDGTGYPLRLRGDEISLAGRIVAVADAYDVITSARSYKRPTDPAVAREELVRCAGGQFDPAVVRAFLNVSLGRLRLVGGPLAWLASLPMVGNLPSTIAAAATNAAVAASVMVATVVGGAAGLPASPHHEVVTTADASSVVPVGATGRRSSEAGTRSGTASGGAATDGASAGDEGEAASPGADASATNAASVGTGGTSSAGGTSAAAGGATATTVVGDPGAAGGSAPSSGVADDPTPTTQPKATTTTATASPTTTHPASTTTHPAATTTVPAPTTTVAVGPTIRADSFSTVQYTQTDFDVLANDSAGTSPLDPSTLTIVSPPAHANNYQVQGSKIRYRSTLLYIGTDSLQYRVCDTSGRCGTATVTFTVSLL